MAKHEIVIRENTGATKLSAPYLGVYQSKGTILVGDSWKELSTLSGLPEIQIKAILEGSFEAFAKLEKQGLVRIYTDLGQICGKIGGSFDTADAPFDAVKNSFDLVLHVSDDIRLALVSVTPTIVTDETVTRVAVNNVVDLETPKPMNLIHGQKHFRIAGYNLVMTDTGAGISLVSDNGTEYPCTVDQAISNQLVEAHSNTLLEGGDYKLYVKSRGGDAEGPLQTVFRKVKYLKVANPTVTNIKSTSASADFHYKIGEDVTITGTSLALGTGETVGLAYDPPGGETVTLTTQVKSSSDTQIVCDGTHGFSEVPEGLTAVVTVKGISKEVVAE